MNSKQRKAWVAAGKPIPGWYPEAIKDKRVRRAMIENWINTGQVIVA